MNKVKQRKYSDFILNLIYFASVYFISIIYDYADNFIILNNHEFWRQAVMCITKAYLMLVPLVTIVLISWNENQPKDAILDTFVAFNVSYVICPFFIYISGFLKQEDYWIGSVILENGILIMDINPFHLILEIVMYTCTGMILLRFILDKKFKIFGLGVTCILISLFLNFFGILDQFAKLSYIPLCIYGEIDQALVEASQFPMEKVGQITWIAWFVKFIIPITIGAFIAVVVDAIVQSIFYNGKKDKEKTKLKFR
jgi:hypothetical protein